MNQKREIGIVGVISVLFAFLYFALMMGLGGCASLPPKAPPVEIQCGPSNYEKCVDKCASQGVGSAPFIVENSVDVACFCRKNRDGT